jgi:putative nucleotidyltransferase with HDIG domain
MSKMNKSVGRLDVNSLWEHNIGIAFTMLVIVHAMPPQMRPNDDLTYLAGMLHDIGYLVLAHIDVARSDELQTRMVTESERLSLAIEHDVVELTHDELGAELANHWNLSEEIVAAIRFHHEPSKSDSDQSLARIINLTEKLLPSFIFHERVDVTITPEDWLALGINPDSAQEISERIAEQAEQASQFISSFN